MTALPKPYYQDSACQIFLGDCRKILPLLPRVDLVLTDPPYGQADKMQGGTWGLRFRHSGMDRWDKSTQPEAVSQCLELLVPTIIWGGNNYALNPSRGWLVWDKQNAVPTMADCELAWTSEDRPMKRFSWPVGKHEYGHPTEKPLELMAWCLSLFPRAQTVLDPFMGSGTTLRAAKDLGRKAIGIEIEERYCEIAARRLAQEVLPLNPIPESPRIEEPQLFA